MGLGEAWPLGGGGLVMLVSGGEPSLIGTVLLHTYTLFLRRYFSLFLSHLAISWRELFPWRTVTVEMDYDYQGSAAAWWHTYTVQRKYGEGPSM